MESEINNDAFVLKDGIAYDKNFNPESHRRNFTEKIFDSPLIYNVKKDLTSLLAPHSLLDLGPYVTGKTVLNVGCGPRTLYFNEELPKKLVGFDPSADAIGKIVKNAAKGFYYVGGAQSIPFPDQYFDTSVMTYVFHHLPFAYEIALNEVVRVTKRNLIIYDNKLSDHPLKRWIQSLYWKMADGGKRYYRSGEWDHLFRNLRVLEKKMTGKMFENVCLFVIEIPRS